MTPHECTIPDAGNTLGDHDGGDPIIVKEQPILNLRHAFGNANLSGSGCKHSNDLCSVGTVNDAIHDFQESAALVFNVGQLAAIRKDAFS